MIELPIGFVRHLLGSDRSSGIDTYIHCTHFEVPIEPASFVVLCFRTLSSVCACVECL